MQGMCTRFRLERHTGTVRKLCSKMPAKYADYPDGGFWVIGELGLRYVLGPRRYASPVNMGVGTTCVYRDHLLSVTKSGICIAVAVPWRGQERVNLSVDYAESSYLSCIIDRLSSLQSPSGMFRDQIVQVHPYMILPEYGARASALIDDEA